MQWFIRAFKQYAVFSGRARRKEYWMYTLFTMILYVVGFALLFALRSAIPFIVIFLALILPSLSVTIRRLHDTGKSGGFFFLSFIPGVGGIIMLVFMCLAGDRGPNRFGPDPKDGTNAPYMEQPQY